MRSMLTEARARRDEGFTLIELLIVIVVLGVLAGIVVLGVNQFRTDATKAACDATKDNLQIAVDAYLTQNAGGTPTTTNIASYVKAGTTVPSGITITSTGGAWTVGGTC